MKKVNITKKTIVASLSVLCLSGVFAIAASAYSGDSGRKGLIDSYGVVEYKDGADTKIKIDAEDLNQLAGEIDDLELAAKGSVVSGLSAVGTYVQDDGTALHTGKTSGDSSTSNYADLDWADVMNAVAASQSIPDDILGEEIYVGLKGENVGKPISNVDDLVEGEDYEIKYLSGATADNLSAGSAAWVDGELVLGNGENNNAYYAVGKGYVIPGHNYIMQESNMISFRTSCHSPQNAYTATFTFDYPVVAFVCITDRSDVMLLNKSTPVISGNTCSITFTDVRASNYDRDGSPTWKDHTASVVVVCDAA